MRRNLISVSFVGVFYEEKREIPLLENRFCKDIFGDPYNTNSGVSPDGFCIDYMGKPAPKIIVGPQRIAFIVTSVDELFEYMSKVEQQINVQTGGKFSFKLKAFGLNYEYEWLDLDEMTQVWLGRKFLANNVCANMSEHFRVLCNTINFSISPTNDTCYNIDIQPRVNVPNGLFAAVNHHHQGILDTLPDDETLSRLYEESRSLLENDILSTIIE